MSKGYNNTERLTCFAIASANSKNIQISQYLVNEEFSTSKININDICDAIKTHIIYKKYNKNIQNEFDFHKKITREIEEILENNNNNYEEYADDDADDDKDKYYEDKYYDEEFVYLLNRLKYNHTFICKLVGENLDEINQTLDRDIKNKTLFKKYDYCYITNLIWVIKYETAKKILNTR